MHFPCSLSGTGILWSTVYGTWGACGKCNSCVSVYTKVESEIYDSMRSAGFSAPSTSKQRGARWLRPASVGFYWNGSEVMVGSGVTLSVRRTCHEKLVPQSSRDATESISILADWNMLRYSIRLPGSLALKTRCYHVWWSESEGLTSSWK